MLPNILQCPVQAPQQHVWSQTSVSLSFRSPGIEGLCKHGVKSNVGGVCRKSERKSYTGTYGGAHTAVQCSAVGENLGQADACQGKVVA